MYALPDLQSLGRQLLLKEGDADRVLTYPIKTMDLLDVVMKNQAALKAHFKQSDATLYGGALFLAKEEIEKLGPEGQAAITNSEIMAFDAKHANSELVYGITKSTLR